VDSKRFGFNVASGAQCDMPINSIALYKYSYLSLPIPYIVYFHFSRTCSGATYDWVGVSCLHW